MDLLQTQLTKNEAQLIFLRANDLNGTVQGKNQKKWYLGNHTQLPYLAEIYFAEK